MSSRFLLAAPAFLVTVVGLSIAVVGRALGVWPALISCLVVFGLGWTAGQIAESAFLPRNPKAAVVMFTVWSLCPGIAAAMAIALIIYLNANFDADSIGATGLDKEMLKTTVAAFTALLTASFIKLLDDADESVVGERVKNAFYAKFKDAQYQVPEGAYPVTLGQSKVEAWVFEESVGGIDGWGWRARWKRAREIAVAMSDPGDVTQVAAFWESRIPAPKPPATVTPAQTPAKEEPVAKIDTAPEPSHKE